MPHQRPARRALLAALSLSLACAGALAPSPAEALVIARVTRNGYIVVDEPDAPEPYEGAAPVESQGALFNFVAELTGLISMVPGAPRPDYVAVMQTERSSSRGALAFYLPLRNDLRGLGMRSPLTRSETYDLNDIVGTFFPLYGYVWLNNIRFYSQPGLEEFYRYLICTQEFGHRFGTFLRLPPRPGAPVPGNDAGALVDAGDPDGGMGMMVMPMLDGGMGMMPPERDAMAPSDAVTDGATTEAGAADATAPQPEGPELPATAALGRDNSHWSYFVNSGGSPMEGNDWEELEPGVFRTRRPSFRFSPLDLYQMGLIPASMVPPFWLIAEPNVMGQRDMSGQPINPASPPEYGGRTITVRGRKVTYTIDDVLRANGARVQIGVDAGAGEPDAGAVVDAGGGREGGAGDGGDPGPVRPQDLRVAWVLLTTAESLANSPSLPTQFDRAVESCARGYDEGTGFLSRLRAIVAPPGALDAGVTDAASEAGATDAAGDARGDGATTGVRAGGGACSVRGASAGSPASGPGDAARGGALGLACVALGVALRSRRRRREGARNDAPRA